MTQILARLWLVVVVLAAGFLALQVHRGLVFRTDLMALLPREEHDPFRQKASDLVTRALSQRLVLLVGHAGRAEARAAAAVVMGRLQGSGLAEIASNGFDQAGLRKVGALYLPYRNGLLAEDDRSRLQAGEAEALAVRALSQAYGFVGLADPGLLRNDPFLLLQAFLSGLPAPSARLALDDGMLSVTEDGITWVLVAARLTGEPYALDVQDRLIKALDLDGLQQGRPGLQVLRLGAVFFANAGAQAALSETTTIGLVSLLGTVLLVLATYRTFVPLWASLLVIAVGVGTAVAGSLLLFGELHVATLLFGVSLIGVAVDYSLQYSTEVFASPAAPAERLKRVFVGVSLGTVTTVIGYLTLFLAPFPGLHQIAAFSAVGLVAAWLTVVLWLPRLDRAPAARHGAVMLALADRFLSFWEAGRLRIAVAAVLGIAGLAGLPWLHSDDDVRKMQSLSPALVAQQERLQRLVGVTGGNQFFLVQAADDEAALRQEEALIARLRPLVSSHMLAGFLASAQFVPSAARQQDNRRLVAERLDPLMAQQVHELGLIRPPAPVESDAPVLTLAEAVSGNGVLASLRVLTPEAGTHVVSLDGVASVGEVALAAAGLEGVHFIDPAGQFSDLLGKYRWRAMALLVLSALLMGLLLALRYGRRGAAWIMLPPLLAVAMAPALRALAGSAFTFFDAMGLVLALSIGVDYAIFCAESTGARQKVTMLAVALAACTALLSFGLLALSRVAAVHAFGMTMLIGILLAFLFSPIARRGRP
jgi:predicted exporter